MALNDAEEIRGHLDHQLDAIIDAGPCGLDVTTVIDISGDAPVLLREGKGDIRPFGFVKAALPLMDFQGIIVYIAVYAIPVVFAITLHEAGHAYAAKYFGDKTAWMLGRTSLNPARHIDPIGTIVVPILTAFTGFLFGWAKPVPVNFENLRDPKRDMLWVAAAGPGANLVMALLWVLVAKVLLAIGGAGIAYEFWIRVADAGIKVNVGLAVLNLFPLLPLDGGRILVSVLPNRLAYQYSRLEPFGMVILILLIVSGALWWVIGPVMAALLKNLYSLVGF